MVAPLLPEWTFPEWIFPETTLIPENFDPKGELERLRQASETLGGAHDEISQDVAALALWLETQTTQLLDCCEDVIVDRWNDLGEALVQKLTDLTSELQTNLQEQVTDRITSITNEQHERLNATCETMHGAMVEWRDQSKKVLMEALHELERHIVSSAENEVRDRIDQLIHRTIGALRDEIADGIALAQLQVQLSSMLSSLYPQLVTVRAVAEMIKRLLALMRMF